MYKKSYVLGGKPADDKYKKMAAAWEACTDAGVDIPVEIEEFFNYTKPDGNTIWSEIKDAITMDCDYGIELWVVDLKKLPDDITLIKFMKPIE